MNISIFASIWAQNLWDECILKNEIELLKWEFWSSLCPSDISLDEGDESSSPSMRGIPAKREGELFFKVASYDAQNPVFQISNAQYFEYFPIGIKNPRNLYRNLNNFFKFLGTIVWSDVVVIGWGGIIYDSEMQSVWNPLNQWTFRTRVARLLRKKIYFYAVGVDIKNSENQKKLQKIFKKAWKVTVRDKKSQGQLKEIWIKSKIVDDPVMSDNTPPVASDIPLYEGEQKESPSSRGQGELSFAQERDTLGWIPAKQEGEFLNILSSKDFNLTDFENIDFSWKKVWLALRSWYMWEGENAKVESLCKYIESQWGKIVFLPHSLHQTDMRANDYEFMKQFLSYDREIYANLWEVYTAYTHNMMDVIISMRLHSIILSYVYGIPQIVLSYSQKTQQAIKKLTK